MDLTPAELTVLALIVEQPSHGYDLERIIDQRGIRRWTDIGFSSIYYVLTRLEKRGLVEAGAAPARSRRIFHATAQGRHIAAAQTLSFISDPRPAHDPLLVGLANLALLSESDYAAALRRRLSALDARISGIRDAAAAQAPLPRAAEEVFSHTLRILDAERSWLQERVGATDV